jgi:hypothetical protein
MWFRSLVFFQPGKKSRTCLLSLAFSCFSFCLFSQGVSPQQQAKIDSLMMYVNLQLKEGKVPDQKYIDSTNAVIRNMNQQTARVDSLGKIIPDSTKEITKQLMAGSIFSVPPGKTWKVKRVYVNDGGSSNILVTSLKFEHTFAAGEKIAVPSWTAEGELLNGDQSGFIYIFKIEEMTLVKGDH